MKAGRWGALVLLLALPTAAWAARIFQWTDKAGQVHITDNLWELPEPVRIRYLELIEEEARAKYTPQQIRAFKEAGNWPPAEFLRPPRLKEAVAKDAEWMGFKLGGEDADLRRALAEEFTFQWENFLQERRALETMLPQLEAAVAQLQQALVGLRTQEATLGLMGDASQVPAAEEALKNAEAELVKLRALRADLPRKEAELLQGRRVYTHPGEDGGVAASFFGRDALK